MSEDDRNNGNGRGKTLLPEFLPAPTAGAMQSPPERVAERTRLLLQRFRGLGTTAGAAVLSLQCNCGYGVVDPLPPPPMQCTVEPIPFASIHVSAVREEAPPRRIVLSLVTNPYPPNNFVGYRIDAVRVTGGTLTNIQDLSQSSAGGGSNFQITIVLDADAGPPTEILVDVDLGCGNATTTKHYSILFSSGGGVIATEILSGADAGVSG
jgi:hypothetical protein